MTEPFHVLASTGATLAPVPLSGLGMAYVVIGTCHPAVCVRLLCQAARKRGDIEVLHSRTRATVQPRETAITLCTFDSDHRGEK